MIKLGFISDEVSQAPEVIVNFAKRHDVKYIELRTILGKGIQDFSLDEIKEINSYFNSNGITIASIASPVYKCNMDNDEEVSKSIETFEKVAAFAKVFGTKLIRGFDFWKNDFPIEERIKKFDSIIKICEKYDVLFLLEYDPSVNSSDAKKVCDMVKRINSPYVRALYDVGNAFWSNHNAVPYPDDYNTLKDLLCHIHIKDAVIIDGKTKGCKIGTGKVDYKGLFSKLISDNYDGFVMLETHYKLSKEISESLLKTPGGNEFSEGGEPASDESMIELKKIISEAKE